MRYRDGRRSLCLSSQSGCPLTCTFCATGSMRFGRNLTASEILDQALHFRRIEPVNHAVFMGMGEPLMNLDAVLARLRAAARPRHRDLAHDDLDRRLGARGSSASRPRGRGSAWRSRCTPPTTTLRSELMPVNDRYPLADVLEACLRWRAARRKRGLRRVPDARRRQRPRPSRRARSAEVARAPRGVQGQPDPLQPDRRRLRRLGPEAIDALPRARSSSAGCRRPCG